MASATSDLQVIADGCLVLSHRLGEWMSNAPTMEEDIALGNIALDLLGQARGLLQFLGGAGLPSLRRLQIVIEAREGRIDLGSDPYAQQSFSSHGYQVLCVFTLADSHITAKVVCNLPRLAVRVGHIPQLKGGAGLSRCRDSYARSVG